MRDAFLLSLLGLCQIGLMLIYPQIGWLLLWSGGSFIVVGLAYAFRKPRLFGKQDDGSLAVLPCAVLLPYLLMTWLIWFCQTRLSREAVCNEVAPGLWVGRHPSASEIPPGVSLVIDLTSEFCVSRGIRTNRTYLALPTLDHTAPELSAFRQVVQKAAAWDGQVYVHCALGHGRSALVAAAVIVVRGVAESPAEAFTIMRRVRRVKWNAEQSKFLTGFAQTL